MGAPFTVEDIPHIPPELRNTAERVANGDRPTTTVRTLLSWFWGYQRRSAYVNAAIRRALNALDLVTIPDFDATYLDGPITFLRRIKDTQAPPVPSEPEKVVLTVQDGNIMADAVLVRARVDPTHRVARLKSAHTKPLCVRPDAPISEAVTLMMAHDYSQLPIIAGERTVKGLISWRSLGSKLAMRQDCQYVRECMERPYTVDLDASLFDAIQLIARYDCVLIRDSANALGGIMTAYDISETFGELAEPFLLLGEIENHIRDLIDGKFSVSELESARDLLDANRPIQDVSDLSFGGYVRLLQDPGQWDRLGLQLDRNTFVERLDEVRVIRNDVMHFDPDSIDEEKLKKLREFANLLRQIQQVLGKWSGQVNSRV